MGERARGVFAALLLVMCLAGAVVSVRLAWAERLLAESTPDTVRRSLDLAPTNARACERRAALEPDQAESWLRSALRLNPYLTTARIDLALRAEFAGNRPGAERLLLEAFQRDQMFLTRWTLANFYFRAGDEANFWRWARAAAEFSHTSLTPLFDLGHRLSPDAAAILSRRLPPRPGVLREYLTYLLSTGRLDATPEIFTRLLAFRRPEDLPTLLAVVDRHLSGGKVARAVAVWNQLAASGLLPYAALDPAQGDSLTNGSLASPTLGQGFDWRVIWNPEAFVSGRRVEFSGKQLDRAEVLWQPVPLAPQGFYTLHYQYSTAHIAPHTGLRWRLLDPRTRQPLAPPSPSLSSEGETEQAWRFPAPPGSGLVHLALVYEREPGTARLQGTLELGLLRLTREGSSAPNPTAPPPALQSWGYLSPARSRPQPASARRN